jgi:AcrR family transcriptional regulator
MNEVARDARVAKGTLYSRFPAKADLFRAIIDEQIESAGSKVSFVGPKPKTLEATLRVYAENSLKESLRPEIVELNRLIYSEAGRFPELGEAVLKRSFVGVHQVSDLIRECAIKEGIPCLEPETVAETFTTLLRGYYGDAMLRGRPLTEADIKAWTRRTVKVFLADRRSW